MRTKRVLGRSHTDHSKGFSALEVLLVMVVSLVIAALAVPGFNQVRRTLRISGDARELNGAINQAKMQAAADFTRTRVYFDLGANTRNTFHVDVWDKTNGCWHVVGDVNNPCLVRGVSPVQSLSQGVTFGSGGVGASPPNTQANLDLTPETCYHTHGIGLGTISATACIVFNSRGVPIVPATGAPYGQDAIYITDGTQVYAVTVGATGMSQVWVNNINGNAHWYGK